MASFFFENPLWLGIVGTVATAIPAYIWTQTGQKAAMLTSIGVAVLAALLVFVNIQVTTERESILELLHDVAKQLEKNNHAAVLAHMHPNAQPNVQRAKSELERIVFSTAKVTRVKSITFNETASPPSAIAEFNAFVEADFKGFRGKVPRFVKVYFMQRDGRWLVHDFEHFDAAEGFRRQSP